MATVARLPRRPIAVELAALILITGGLIGLSQLVAGTYVLTGGLPAPAPIVGVAAAVYAGLVALGFVLRTGRGWLAGLNASILVALLYLPAVGRPLFLGLLVAHVVAAAALVSSRPWFTRMANERRKGRV